jgi:ParB-like chromosome segregation protein Spo0J
MKVALKNVLPNPFRDMDQYPINGQKIAALKKSIEDTDFWDNIVAREVAGGKIEIAYGHHRLTALRELYKPGETFDWIIRDLDDEEMLKIMAHENLEEWGHVSDIERETVRAVVKAFGDDRISLKPPGSNANSTHLRYAPSFCFGAGAGSASAHPYTASTVATFLGWEEKTVSYTLRALCLIEQKHLKESQLKGLTHNQARTVVDETNRALKQAEAIRKDAEREAKLETNPKRQQAIQQDAKERGKHVVAKTTMAVSKTLQGGGSASDAKSRGVDARVAARGGKEKELPEINNACDQVARRVTRLLDPEFDPGMKIEELIKHKAHLSPVSKQNLDRALEIAIEYAQGYRVRLK